MKIDDPVRRAPVRARRRLSPSRRPVHRLAALILLMAALLPPVMGHGATSRPSSKPGKQTLSFLIWDVGLRDLLACTAKAGPLSAACEAKVRADPGHRMALAATGSFGSSTVSPAPRARPSRLPLTGLALFRRHRKAVSRLLKLFITRAIKAEALEDLVELFPRRRMPKGKMLVFPVGLGHPMGDAYVARVKRRPNWRLAPRGQPAIFVNLSIWAAWAKRRRLGRERVLDSMQGLMLHEAFHSVFGRFRLRSVEWRRWERSRSRRPIHRLLRIVLDEGIAHYLQRRKRLRTEPLPMPKVRRAFAALNRAAAQLTRPGVKRSTVDRLLRTARQGRYWRKYGSIAGMTMAFFADRIEGMAPLRLAIRCGPLHLVEAWARLRKGREGLPAIGPKLTRAARSFPVTCPDIPGGARRAR